MIDFTNYEYLATGNLKQKKLFELLSEYAVFESLNLFTPVLAGTIPINIDIDSSDVDILCKWENKSQFKRTLENRFGKFLNFNIYETKIEKEDTVISCFDIENFSFEIFGQTIHTTKQRAFLHMIIEYQIMLEKGEDFRRKIIELKKTGIKTEPAFAKLLGLKGDAYVELLEYKRD